MFKIALVIKIQKRLLKEILSRILPNSNFKDVNKTTVEKHANSFTTNIAHLPK